MSGLKEVFTVKLGELDSKISSRLEQDRKQWEEAAKLELQLFQQNLSACVNDVLCTTEDAIRSQSVTFAESLNAEIIRLDKRHRQWTKIFSRTLLGHSLLGMCLFVGMIAASWGLMLFINHRLESLWNEIDELKGQRTELTNTVNKLQVKTWGIRLLEDKSGRFIVLPKGSTIKNNWAWGDSPALKLE